MVEDNEYFDDIKNDKNFKSIFEENQAEIIAFPLYVTSSQLVINNFSKTNLTNLTNLINLIIYFRQKQRLLLRSGMTIKLLQKLLCNYSNNPKKIIQNVKSIISQRHYKGIKGKGEYFYKEAIKYFDNNTSIELNKTCIELLNKSTLLQYNDAMLKLAYLLNNTNFTAGTILNDTIYIKKNNLNTRYKNLVISANVNLASINSKLSMNRRGTGMSLICLYDFSCKSQRSFSCLF